MGYNVTLTVQQNAEGETSREPPRRPPSRPSLGRVTPSPWRRSSSSPPPPLSLDFFLARRSPPALSSLSPGHSEGGLELQDAEEEFRGRLRLSAGLARERRELEEVSPLILQVHRRSSLEARQSEFLDDGPSAPGTPLDAVHERLSLDERPRRVMLTSPRALGRRPAADPSPDPAPPRARGEPFCAASSRTRARSAWGTSVASLRLYSTGRTAMRRRLRHLSFRSTAERVASAALTPPLAAT